MEHVGIDLHQKYSQFCCLSSEGEFVEGSRVPTTEASLKRWFGSHPSCQAILESGGSSAWVTRILRDLGVDVIVVDPRRIRLIAESSLKTDEIDAEILARLSLAAGPELLRPVHQRSHAASLLQARLRARSSLVRSRTSLRNSVRGTLRSMGYRITGATVSRFVASYGGLELEAELRHALDPQVEMVVELTQQIGSMDLELKKRSREDPLLKRLQTVPGVGRVVSLAFVSWIDDPWRFRRSRDVGAYLGLRPRIRQSSTREYRGPITREGNSEMRRLLVQSAHVLLLTKADCALKQWAEGLAQRIGKKKALVALARKLAVLLHHLWVSGESFRPFPEDARRLPAIN